MSEFSEKTQLLIGCVAQNIFEDIIPAPITIKCKDKEVRHVDYSDEKLRVAFEDIIKEIDFSELQISILHERYYHHRNQAPMSFGTISHIYHTPVNIILDGYNTALKLIYAQQSRIEEMLSTDE